MAAKCSEPNCNGDLIKSGQGMTCQKCHHRYSLDY